MCAWRADALVALGASATSALESPAGVLEVRVTRACVPPPLATGRLDAALTRPSLPQTSEAAARERLIERQILRERLALEGAASTYRTIGVPLLPTY